MDGKTLTEAVRVERRGAVLLLILAQRPVNVLSQHLRATLCSQVGSIPDESCAHLPVNEADP